MSKTLLKKVVVSYLTNDEIKKMDRYRGPISVSRIGAIAIRRLLDDLDKGKVNLLEERGLEVRDNDK